MRQDGCKVGALKITTIYPFHESSIRKFMDRCDEVLIPELNGQGQLALLIGHLFHKDLIRLNMVTGVPIYPSIIRDKIKELDGERSK